MEIDRLEAEFAQLAWAGHQRGIGAVDGSVSTQAWLRHRTGMREGEARATIEAGRVSELLTKIGAAWRSGEITGGAAKTIVAARVEGHDLELRALEETFLFLARADDQRELRRACTHFRNCATAEGTEPRAHDGLSISTGYAGRGLIQADLSSTRSRPSPPRSTRSPTRRPRATPPASRRRADALVRMAEIAMANLRHRPRPAGPGAPPARS